MTPLKQRPAFILAQPPGTNTYICSMRTIHHNGMTYKVIVKPWKKGDKRFEVIKHPRNFSNLWERTTLADYRLAAQG